MKRRVLALIAALVVVMASDAPSSQSAMTFKTFAPTRMSLQPQHAGCACGADGDDIRYRGIDVQQEVFARVGQPVALRFDASTICRGQTILDTNNVRLVHGGQGPAVGRIRWAPGLSHQLPDVFGIATLTGGYATGGKYTIELDLDVRCFDTGSECKIGNKYVECSAKATVPVVVR
jgi:hypothetical protein